MAMEPFTTHLFRFATSASPERVWQALTSGRLTARYFCGMAAESTWEPGSRITFHVDSVVVLAGEVVAAEWPHRLCYTVAPGAQQPPLFVTWEVRAADTGAIVRLLVDDVDPAPDAEQQAEAGWLPVIARLQSMLQAEQGEALPQERTD